MFKNGCKVVLEFMKNNANTIISIGSAVGMVILAKKFGIPIRTGFNAFSPYNYPTIDISEIITGITSSPTNSTETAIMHIKNQTTNMMFDSNKMVAANNIVKAVKEGKDITENTKSYAIKALSDISDGLMFSSNKETISGLIMDILKKEVEDERVEI